MRILVLVLVGASTVLAQNPQPIQRSADGTKKLLPDDFTHQRRLIDPGAMSTNTYIDFNHKTTTWKLSNHSQFYFTNLPTSTNIERTVYATIIGTYQFTNVTDAIQWNSPLTSASETNEYEFTWRLGMIHGSLLTATIATVEIGDRQVTAAKITGLPTVVKLSFPRRVDGAGCVYSNTNDLAADHFLVPLFSGTAASNVNYCRFGFRIPLDMDTSIDLAAAITVSLSGADTAAQQFHVGMASVANSAAISATAANFIALDIAADASGADGDAEASSGFTTLTGWKEAVTPGQWWFVELRRNGADASTVASYLQELEIRYARNP